MRISDEALAAIKWNEQGLIPAVIQDAGTRDVLMMAFMNAAALQRTLELGEVVFWSRRRGKLWRKGETSGNTLRVVDIRVDCDADTLLVLAEAAGPTCHTNAVSCFFRDLDEFIADPKRY